MLKSRTLLLMVSVAALAACDTKYVYVPQYITVVPTPTPSPSPSGSPTPTAPSASACPTGTGDGGTLTSAGGVPLRVCQLSGRVTANMTLANRAGLVYSLAGPVEVGGDVGGDGAGSGPQVTLTIEAGTVILGAAAVDRLIVNRGSQISAVGTASAPIIFTSRQNLLGTATETDQGQWGGIALLGRAPISDCAGAVPGGSAGCQQALPDFTANFGGNAPNDTSGTFSFVQIRFAGAGSGDPVALRLAGVGQLATIDHVQVMNSGGDGIALSGGRVNLSSIALTGIADDAIDSDIGYRGTIQFVVAVQSGPGNGDALIEADSNGNEDGLPRQYARLANATLIARSTGGGGNAVLLRGGTDFALVNSVVVGPQTCLDIDETAGTTTRAAETALQDLGAPVFRSVLLGCATAFRDDGNVNVATIGTLFGSGTNGNNSTYTPSLTGIVNGATENGVSPLNPTSFNADIFAGTGQPNGAAPNRLIAVSYIGAVQNSSDTRFQGWTCNATFVSFGTGTNCIAAPR